MCACACAYTNKKAQYLTCKLRENYEKERNSSSGSSRREKKIKSNRKGSEWMGEHICGIVCSKLNTMIESVNVMCIILSIQKYNKIPFEIKFYDFALKLNEFSIWRYLNWFRQKKIALKVAKEWEKDCSVYVYSIK